VCACVRDLKKPAPMALGMEPRLLAILRVWTTSNLLTMYRSMALLSGLFCVACARKLGLANRKWRFGLA
jgi:hypothetical protein